MLKNFEKLLKNVQSNWLAETLVDSYWKNSLIITVVCHKNFFPIWHFNDVVLIYLPVPFMSHNLIFFLTRVLQSLKDKIASLFLSQHSKTVAHFRDGSGRLFFLTNPVIPLIIFARQNYFYQTFYFKKTSLEICNNTHLPI